MRTKQEFIERAKSEGFSGETFKGAAKYWRMHHVERTLPLDIRGSIYDSHDRAVKWKAMDAARKSNPEAKRARYDAKFRKNWLKRIAREQATLLAQPRTLAEVTRKQLTIPSINARLRVIAEQRGIGLGRKQEPQTYALDKDAVGCWALTGRSIPDTASQAAKHGARYESGYKWDIYAGFSSRVTEHRCSESGHKNGKWFTITTASHKAVFRSFGLLDKADASNLLVAFGDREFNVRIVGGTWAIDQHGIHVVIGPDDYHPTIDDLLRDDTASHIAAKVQENAGTRKMLAAQRLADEAEMCGVFVCVADSVRAGNCLAGSHSFTQRHGLNPARHYHAPELLAMGNGDTGRVRLAIKAAINRHNVEMERGYADLKDHQCSQP